MIADNSLSALSYACAIDEVLGWCVSAVDSCEAVLSYVLGRKGGNRGIEISICSRSDIKCTFQLDSHHAEPTRERHASDVSVVDGTTPFYISSALIRCGHAVPLRVVVAFHVVYPVFPFVCLAAHNWKLLRWTSTSTKMSNFYCYPSKARGLPKGFTKLDERHHFLTFGR